MATELQSYAGLHTVVSFLAISLPISCDSLIVYFIRSPIVERNNRDVLNSAKPIFLGGGPSYRRHSFAVKIREELSPTLCGKMLCVSAQRYNIKVRKLDMKSARSAPSLRLPEGEDRDRWGAMQKEKAACCVFGLTNRQTV